MYLIHSILLVFFIYSFFYLTGPTTMGSSTDGK